VQTVQEGVADTPQTRMAIGDSRLARSVVLARVETHSMETPPHGDRDSMESPWRLLPISPYGVGRQGKGRKGCKNGHLVYFTYACH
jgi:hypothetical protein